MATTSGGTDDPVTPSAESARAAAAGGQRYVHGALALALYGLLLDAAIETWWSASPVRVWVVATVAIYTVVTALLWRRITWRTHATASACLVLGLVAATTWLPGGLTVGVRMAGRATATVLAALSAAGVALAGALVWRFRAVPRPVRIGVLLLAAYGWIAFVYGVIAGVPFAALFGGDSLWQRLPAALQGAFVGGIIVLPLALLVSVVRAGIPRFRERSPLYALYQVVALTTCFAMVLAALPRASVSRHASEASETASGFRVPQIVPIVPSPALSDALENSLRAVEDGEREAPRDRWDPTYVVAHVGKDPSQLFDWVARNTFWIPYRGLLRGPVGVLMDRMGGSLDRAVLLATLLNSAGHSVRLAHAELPRERAAALLPALIVARSAGQAPRDAPPPGPGDVRQAAEQYQLDGPGIDRALASSTADGKRIYSALGVRVREQTARLRAAVAGHVANGGGQSRGDAAIEVLRDHWWVQRLDAGTWVDLDLLSADSKAIAAAQETVALDAVAASQAHQVVVRVVSEQWNNGRVAA